MRSADGIILPLLELSQFFSNRPVAEGKDEWHNYVCHRYNHQQAECPAVAGLGEYSAEDKDRYGGCYEAEKEHQQAEYYCEHSGL